MTHQQRERNRVLAETLALGFCEEHISYRVGLAFCAHIPNGAWVEADNSGHVIGGECGNVDWECSARSVIRAGRRAWKRFHDQHGEYRIVWKDGKPHTERRLA